MIALRFMGAWLGSAALLMGVLWFCEWRTERKRRHDDIIRRVNDARYF